jgi:hypothetical protein
MEVGDWVKCGCSKCKKDSDAGWFRAHMNYVTKKFVHYLPGHNRHLGTLNMNGD